MKKTHSLLLAIVLFGAVFAVALADGRPHEGKSVRIDPDQKMPVVSGEHNDEWSLYWTESTKWKGVTAPELAVGDSVHFDFTGKDGQRWVTELKRTHKARF